MQETRSTEYGKGGYEDLEIYHMAHDLALKIHAMSLNLPQFELYEQGSQIRRSSKSVCANIVEGFGRRRYKNEFIQFLTYALASCDETKEHLKLLFNSGSLQDKKTYEELSQNYRNLGGKIFNFIQAVSLGHRKMTSLAFVLLLASCILYLASSLMAGQRDVGTSQGQILKIGIGNPEALALGRSYTAMADGVESMNFNPAGLARANAKEFAMAITNWVDGFTGQYLAYGHPHMRSNLGVNAAYFTLDGFDVRDSQGLPLSGTDVFVRTGFAGIVFAWSLPAERVFLGSGIKTVFEDFAGIKSTNFAGDAGLLWEKDGPWTFGVSMLNLSLDAKKIPWSFRGGAAYAFPEYVTLSADFMEDRDAKSRIGVGASFDLPEAAELGFLTLRLGYYTADDQGESNLGVLKSFNLHRSSGLSFGVGVETENATLHNVKLDYALVPLGALGTSHHVMVKLRF